MEEILLRHRALIDDAVRSLEEKTLIDGFVADLNARIAALRLREPSFWELRVVEHIHNVITSELKRRLRDGTCNGDVERVQENIRAHLREHLQRLLDLLENAGHLYDPSQLNQFLESLWTDIAQCMATASASPEADDAVDVEDEDASAEQPSSYEVITFDDLQFETGSVNSVPSSEDIPMILEDITSSSSEDRRAALQRLSQISPLELVRCVMHFQQVVQRLCCRLLDHEQDIANESLRLLYGIITYIDDASQYLDLYFIIVDWIGSRVSSRELTIAVSDIFSEDDTILTTVDAFRLLHLVMCRVPYHWIHFSPEMFARVICSTFIVLLLDPPSADKKLCRPVDVLSVIDPEAKWFVKWTMKVPSRAQLFVSLDETGFLSDFMYAMTRVRPFETEIEPLERLKTKNMLTILAISACYNAGRSFVTQWTKLPAHLQEQRRYTKWIGLENQFQLASVGDENDKLYTCTRTDRTVKSVHGMALEDGGPLGDQAITGIALSAIVLHLFDQTVSDSEIACLASACKSITVRPPRQDDLAILFEFVAHYGSSRSGSIVGPGAGAEELEDQDPWFPFRRPKQIETVVKYAADTAAKRGLSPSLTFTGKCARVFESLLESTATISFVSPRLASAICRAAEDYLDHVLEDDNRYGASRVCNVVENLRRLVVSTCNPFTVGDALAGGFVSSLSTFVRQTSDRVIHQAVFGLVLAVTQFSASSRALVATNLWQQSVQHSLHTWQATSDLNGHMLQLLLVPTVVETVCQSEGIRNALVFIDQACTLDLDTAVALNSPPSEAPFQLRQLSHTIASLRAVLGTQFAGKMFTAHDSELSNFLAESVVRHMQGTCGRDPQTEDRCTVAFELLTAAAGCIPSMVGIYELLTQCDARSLQHDHDTSISACSWLASSLASSLAHVGGHRSDWIRPRPLSQFLSEEASEHKIASTRRCSGSSATLVFTSSTIGALDQMMASINDSETKGVPLDMVMLSQATWEVLVDVERCSGRDPESYRTLTHALGKLIYALAMSGQSKIGEAEPTTSVGEGSGTRSLEYNAGQRAAAGSFPSDAERKLMNVYYKDYCARLGLKATPTMLHVLSKIFGTAAMDCFSCSALIILDQTQSANEIIQFLEYCAACPSMYVLWPRLLDNPSDQHVPALLPLAQAAEMILEVEFPQIFSTLRQCNCSVLTLVLRWHTQCYWNFLPWEHILIMVYLTFLYGVEFQAYFFVVVVQHFEPTIRAIVARNSGDPARAYVETLQTPIEGFCFHTSRNVFLTLRSTYHDRIQQILRQ